MTAPLRDQLRDKASNRSREAALAAMRDADGQTLEGLIFEVGKKITLPEIAKYIVQEIKEGDKRAKREFIGAYIDMLKLSPSLRD